MEGKILKLFRKEEAGFLSGEQISEPLGISRSAVWKHIEKLRALGYEFDAVPHLGYRLSKTPDKLYAFELESILDTRTLGNRIVYFDTIGSTNKEAYERANNGCAEGLLVVAERQTKGRGRLSREWVSPKQKGIYMSLVLRPKITPYQAPMITLIAAVSIASALRGCCGLSALIKWPNDIFVAHKKVGGILTEMEAESDSINFLVIGIGINVNTRSSELPKGATSLMEESGEKVSRAAVVKAVLESFETYYRRFMESGFADIRKEWRDLSTTLGRRVRSTCLHRKVEGEAVDLNADGSLKIRLDNGFYENIIAGDVTLLR